MITSSSLTNGTLTVIIDNGKEIITARNDHPKWAEILESYKASPTNPRLQELLSMKAVVEEYSVGMLSINSTGVTYRGVPLHTVDADRVMAFMRDNLPYQPIANYIARKLKNPSARAIQEMYSFLENGNMTLTPQGTFIGYKGLQEDFWSIQGNKETVVLQGQVNEKGQILNTIGSTIEVERSSVCDDFRSPCGAGLHVGSLAYAKGWGRRVVLVEVDPADVVSVPVDSSCQKLRCCKYKVIGDYTGPMPETLTTEFVEEDEGICHECGAPDGECDCDTWNDDKEDTTDTNETPESDVVPLTPVEEVTTTPEVLEKQKESARQLLGLEPSETYKKVADIFSEQLAITIDNPDITIGEIQVDSLDAVKLIMAFEEEFSIEIPDADTEAFTNSSKFSDVVKYIEDRITADKMQRAYNLGNVEGRKDKSYSLPAKYLLSDANGADSDLHSQFIKGYVSGYGW